MKMFKYIPGEIVRKKNGYCEGLEMTGVMYGICSTILRAGSHSKVYSVMQSDGNGFCGDVVLDGFNMYYRDEDSILEQSYQKKISLNFYYEDLLF